MWTTVPLPFVARADVELVDDRADDRHAHAALERLRRAARLDELLGQRHLEPGALVLDDHLEALVADDELDRHRAVLPAVRVPDRVPAGLGHRELQVGELLRRPAAGCAPGRRARAGRAAGSPASRGSSDARRSHSSPTDTSSILPRMTVSARRRRRETCICEIPTSAAICDCVISSKKRSSTIRRSRSSRASSPAAISELSSISSKPVSSVAELLGERVVAPVLERRRERARGVRVGRVERVDHLFLVGAGRLGELGDGRRAAQLGRQLVEHAREADAQLLEAARDVHRPRLVAEVPPDLADDRRHGVARELDAAVDVEPVDGLDQPERADLDEVLERLAATRVAVRERPHERHELDERRSRASRSPSRWYARRSASTSRSISSCIGPRSSRPVAHGRGEYALAHERVGQLSRASGTAARDGSNGPATSGRRARAGAAPWSSSSGRGCCGPSPPRRAGRACARAETRGGCGARRGGPTRCPLARASTPSSTRRAARAPC